jgi:hypothetical protein
MERVEKVAKFLLNFSQLNKANYFFLARREPEAREATEEKKRRSEVSTAGQAELIS